jgi:hypothetical protein
MRRAVRAAQLPTRAEVAKMAAEQSAAAEQGPWTPDLFRAESHEALHRFLDRAAARYRAGMPDDFEPLQKSLDAWRAALAKSRAAQHTVDHDREMSRIRAEIQLGPPKPEVHQAVDEDHDEERPTPQEPRRLN